MIITVASFKGGVAKTTTAVHLATCLNEKAKTLLIDGDPNRSASGWAKRGNLPFTVIDERQAAKQARHFEHIVIDTQARPEQEDLEALADGCDLLIIPSTPDALALDALMLTVNVLQHIGNERYKVLLTIIPPKPSRDGDEARHMLNQAGLPLFCSSIRRLAAFQKAAQSRNQDVVEPVQAETKPHSSGRPRGKRSNPDYEQVTAYIKKETYRNTKIALLQQGNNQEFSELVEQLLSDWLSTQKSNNSNT